MIVKVKEVVRYGGHTIRANGVVDISFDAAYSELTNSVMMLQLLNNDVSIKAKIPGKKAFHLGGFRVDRLQVDNDGESHIKFRGVTDYIETDNLMMMPLKGDDVPDFQILVEGEVEKEDDADVEQ